MIVRFAIVCDLCGKRGREYMGGLACCVCGRDVCKECAALYDPDPPGRALCRECVVPACPEECDGCRAPFNDADRPPSGKCRACEA